MKIHPEFDVETKTWFWQQYEARTIRELRQKIGPKTTVANYYPNGYDGSLLMTERRRQDLAPTIAPVPAELRIVVVGERKIDTHEKKTRTYTLRVSRVAGVVWSPAELEDLQQLVLRGHSASEIANSLGRTRNSIVGKATRMGLRIGICNQIGLRIEKSCR